MLVVSIMLVLLVIIHYHELLAHVWLLDRISSTLELGLTRQTFGRILFLIPIAYGAAVLGTGAGLSTLVLSLAAMLPRVFLVSPAPREAVFETGGIALTGALIVVLFDFMQKGRRQLIELEKTHDTLNKQIGRLGMLHIISGMLSQSLELGQVLSAVRMVGQLIQTGTAWLYLWDEEKKELSLISANGLPESTLPKTLTLGACSDGVAAESRQPVIIDNVSDEPRFGSVWPRPGNLQSMLIVPLTAQDELVGTLGVGTRTVHHFLPDEVDLLRATADQFSMAVANARFYERERMVAEALRVSERNYRELFENASDAIWVHDLDGKILAVNSAFERLTGYEYNALIGANVSMFFSAHGMSKVDKEAHDAVLRGEVAEPYEQELIKKNGSVAIINIGTSLVTKDEKPWAFQHIARDITEEKKVQDNLRSYVQQVSQAQEAERKRIARELHDVTAQALVTVVRNLGDLVSDHSQFSIKEIQEQVRGILREVRRFSQQLRPSVLDDLGLLPAIKWLASDLTKNYNIPVDVNVAGELHQLPPDAELMLFRITQEALNNVQRHSGASMVSITMEFTDQVTRVTVGDNGKGFEMPERMGDLARIGKLGLAGMQERVQLLGGNLTIDTGPGKGTSLTVTVPR